jgi:HAD superfamily hydrolase (TIGR01509 family)
MADFALIFDVDGVLIDSVAAAYRVRARLLASYGVDIAQIPDPHHEGHKGSSLKHLLMAVNQHAGVEIDEASFAEAAVKGMRNEFEGTRVDTRLLALLRELKQHGIPCGIASSGRPEGVRIKLEVLGIGDYFDQIVTAGDVTRHKPDPEIYLLTAERLGLDIKRCIIIEDSAAGVAAGKAAGGTVIGFTQYNQDKTPLAGVRFTVDGWDGLSYLRLRELVG